MFGFSKKKDEAALAKAPVGNNLQTSKIEDDMASFEIPDFSDDDLNFDLGLGEFVPQGGLAHPAETPKGLPTQPDEKPQSTTETQTIQMPVTAAIQETALPSEPTSSNNDAEAEDEVTEIDDLDLPKFNTQSSAAVIDDVKVQAKAEPVKHKEHHSKAHSEIKKREPKHYAQASPEGFFVPKEIHKKMIVLSDDISKKSTHSEDLLRSIHTFSKNKKEQIFDADKDSKAIRDQMLHADAMLFGGL